MNPIAIAGIFVLGAAFLFIMLLLVFLLAGAGARKRRTSYRYHNDWRYYGRRRHMHGGRWHGH